MKVNPVIFKEYDVRGLYPKELNEKTAYELGRIFCVFLKLNQTTDGKIVVGHDSRPSSPKLSKSFISGIIDSGVDAIDIGDTKTPMLYFAVPFCKANGGAMITASHNMKKYNGIKFARASAEPIGGLEIKTAPSAEKSKTKGIIKKIDVEKDYFKKVNSEFTPNKIKIKASFDYDADRLIIKGFRGDIIGGIIADTVAKKGDIVIYDLRCSRGVVEYLKNKGIKATPCRVGHFNIKKLMREKKAVFAMEITGHYYFKEFHYCESPHYGLIKLAEQTAKTGKTLKELSKPFMKYHHSGLLNFKVKHLEKIFEKLKEKYKNGAQNEMDGLTVEFSNWWFNIRESHTEPLARLVVEANSEKLLQEKIRELKKLIIN